MEDFKINIKIKLSALWTSLMFCYIYGDYFELYVPNKVKGLIDGNNMLDSPFKLFLATLLLVVPALMIFLSLILLPGINRILNIILGIVFTTIMVLIGLTSLTSWLTFYAFLAAIESVITLTIIFQAWNWPKTTNRPSTHK
jgi:hypothetical protein